MTDFEQYLDSFWTLRKARSSFNRDKRFLLDDAEYFFIDQFCKCYPYRDTATAEDLYILNKIAKVCRDANLAKKYNRDWGFALTSLKRKIYEFKNKFLETLKPEETHYSESVRTIVHEFSYGETLKETCAVIDWYAYYSIDGKGFHSPISEKDAKEYKDEGIPVRPLENEFTVGVNDADLSRWREVLYTYFHISLVDVDSF